MPALEELGGRLKVGRADKEILSVRIAAKNWKYYGFTFVELAKTDKSYLLWLRDQKWLPEEFKFYIDDVVEETQF